MRLCFVNCLLLASVAVAVANGRQKRDFSFLRNLMASTIFGRIQSPPVIETETGYKLYRLPGSDNMFIKAMPTSPVVQDFLYPKLKPINLNAFGSVVGTKSNDDTIAALKGVKTLLSSGILRGNHNDFLKETMVPMFPTLNIRENVGQGFETAPIIETKESVLTEVIKPSEEKVNLQVPFEPNHLYEQMQKNKPEMTYTAQYNPYMKVVETIEKKSELPMSIRKRINEDINLVADPYQVVPVQAVFPFQARPVAEISYPRVETRPYIRNPWNPTMLTEQLETFAEFGLYPEPLKVVKVNHNVRRPVKTQTVNSYPLPLYNYPNLDVRNINVPKNNVNSQVGRVNDDNVPKFDTRIGISQTLGPIPPQYIPHSTKKELIQGTKDNAVDETSTSNMGPTGIVSNGMIPIYVYKQQNNPNTAKVVKLEDKVKTNAITKSNDKVPSYYYVPPIINSEATKTQKTNVKDGLRTNRVVANPQSVTEPVTQSSTNGLKENLLKENEQTYYKGKPTLQHYIYQKKNIDGSFLYVKGNKHGVSVNVKEGNARRGDIPDEILNKKT